MAALSQVTFQPVLSFWPVSRPVALGLTSIRSHPPKRRATLRSLPATRVSSGARRRRVPCASLDRNEEFRDAAKEGKLETMQTLLADASAGVDVTQPSNNRGAWTAIHLSAYYGHPEVTRYLLEAGAEVDCRNASGNTPLQLASISGHIEVARLLLDAGADLYAQSTDRGTAVEYAQEWGGEDMVEFLLTWAANNR